MPNKRKKINWDYEVITKHRNVEKAKRGSSFYFYKRGGYQFGIFYIFYNFVTYRRICEILLVLERGLFRNWPRKYLMTDFRDGKRNSSICDGKLLANQTIADICISMESLRKHTT